MIPERIALKGFLSYDAEQVFEFDGAPLWLLAGPNGSGKSAVFDGITFCLFGGHRGGKDDHHELINKRNETGAAEFDFLLDGQLYRIRRTLKRKKTGGASGTQQVLRWHPAADTEGSGEWRAVPDTGRKTEFDRWVRENVGLNHDTFTASVLLVQGRADRLLTADPKDRHQLLARILGMERYERLHARAVVERNTLEVQAAALRNRLDGLEEVTETDLEAAALAVRTAEGDLEKANAVVERLQGLEVQAVRWNEIQAGLADVLARTSQAEGVLARAATIERDRERFQELRTALPLWGRVLQSRESLATADTALALLGRQQRELEEKALLLDGAASRVNGERERLEKDLASEEQERREGAGRLQALALALPQLRALHRDRARLCQAREEAARAAAEESRVEVEIQRQRHETAELARQLAEASEVRRQADHTVTRQETLLAEVRERSQRFRGVVGEKMCRYCGQPLSPGHVREETAKLEKELAAADATHREACAARAARVEAEKQWEEWHRAAARLLAETEARAAACRRRRENATAEARRGAESCERAYEELAEPYRGRVASALPGEWQATLFPTAADLADLQRQAAELQAEDRSGGERLQGVRERIRAVQREEKRLEQERAGARQSLEEVRKQTAVQETLRRTSSEAHAAALAELGPAWKDRADRVTGADVAGWQAEFADLAARGVEAEARELTKARLALEGLARRKQELEAQGAAILEEARCPSEAVRALLAEARHKEKGCTEDLVRCRNDRQRLLDRQRERRELTDERARLVRNHSHFALLAKYLDRDWLQRHLMRQAETAIVAYARDILDRLSGGQLCLRLRGEEGTSGGDKALVLEAYNRTSADGHPHRVEMLSGSERFRVAVSLALAIGQYASRQHRPIQSVIIDEGFGCLDPANRQLMIQELHNLQGHLHRVLLVSHQEEFAEAFPNGYRLELEEGATRVRRFCD